MDFYTALGKIGDLLVHLTSEHESQIGDLEAHITTQRALLETAGVDVPEYSPSKKRARASTYHSSRGMSRGQSFFLKKGSREGLGEGVREVDVSTLASAMRDRGRSSSGDLAQDTTAFGKQQRISSTTVFSQRGDELSGLSKWDVMERIQSATASSGSGVENSAGFAEVLKMGHGDSVEKKGLGFELKFAWTQVPKGEDVFLDEVDHFLVEKSLAAMAENERNQRRTSVIGSAFGNRQSLMKITYERCPHFKLRFPIVNPGSPHRLAWDLAGMLLITYDMIAIPIVLAFNPKPTLFTEVMGWLTLLFWTCDMLASCFTGFYKDGDLVMHHYRILKNYLAGWFWIDCIVVVPDWVIKVVLQSGNSTNPGGLTRMLRLGRIIRILRLLRLLKLKRLFTIIYDMIDSEVMFIAFNLMRLMISIILMNHFVACAWFGIGKLSKDAKQRNWLQNTGTYPVDQDELAYQYLTSLHWSITQFTPASMDVFATNVAERAYSVLILFWALLALSSLIGSISASVAQLRNISADENKNLWVLRRYLRQRKISRELTGRIMTYIEYQQMSKHNQIAPSEVKLLNSMSDQFKFEMAYETMLPFIGVHPFFEYMDADETLVQTMHKLCYLGFKLTAFASGEFVYQLGDEGKSMVFVKNGCLDYSLGEGKVAHDVTTKLWTSEAILWTAWRHRGWLKAQEPSDVLSLCPDKFSEIMHLHPKPSYLGMHYAIDFVNFLNRQDAKALTDIIFDAEVWVTVVQESDTYVVRRKVKGLPEQASRLGRSTESNPESSFGVRSSLDSNLSCHPEVAEDSKTTFDWHDTSQSKETKDSKADSSDVGRAIRPSTSSVTFNLEATVHSIGDANQSSESERGASDSDRASTDEKRESVSYGQTITGSQRRSTQEAARAQEAQDSHNPMSSAAMQEGHTDWPRSVFVTI